jgi:ferric-dicitrate binding protein FerR (iron transport regulator)
VNTTTCETVREWIPDYVGSRLAEANLGATEAHFEACGSCRAEAELASMLLASRPEVPAGLALRIKGSVLADRRSVRRPWWGLSAAAVAALAFGIGLSNGADPESAVVPGYAYETETTELWPGDDGLIAGAPSLEDLSDEALATLLAELTAGSAGGAA